MKKILVIMGTRPEVIKLAPVIEKLKEHPKSFSTMVCLTGQHQEMLYQTLDHFEIDRDYDLKIMKQGQTLFDVTANLVKKMEPILASVKPDLILVQGDTTTAFIGGLAGYYKSIPVGHVEAGLRTDNKYAPFPEEINRRLLSVLADHHFTPTVRAKKALLNEGVKESSILVTGNTVIDALFLTLKKINKKSPTLNGLDSIINNGKRIILITGHRRENFGEGFKNICTAIRALAEEYKEEAFVYPVHLNPNVQEPVYAMLGKLKNVHLIQPMGYVPFVKLMNASYLILTDSGGIQEEAPSLGKPVLVMREVTERPEAVEAGTAILVGTDTDKIINETKRLLVDPVAWRAMSQINNPYGDGQAANRIVEYISNQEFRKK